MLRQTMAAIGTLLVVGCSTTPTVAGTWTGKLASPHQVGFRFVLEDTDGQLTGRTWVEDDVTHVFEPEATISGTRDGVGAAWTSETGVAVAGTFDGNHFTGTLTFPADGDEPSHTAGLVLSR